MRRLVNKRRRGYDSVRDLWMRSGLSRRAIEQLAEADAFRSIGLDSRDALWAVKALDPFPRRAAASRSPRDTGGPAIAEPDIDLPPMPLGEQVINDYQSLSLSLKAHPISFLRARLDGIRLQRPMSICAGIRSGGMVKVAGLVLVSQRPGSAKGVMFMTIEDETGVANVIVWPKVFEKFRRHRARQPLVGVSRQAAE
jgi:DNA polymerase III alpha subunit